MVWVVLLGLSLVDRKIVLIENLLRLEVFFVSETLLTCVHWLNLLDDRMWLVLVGYALPKALPAFASRVDPL